jgi:hypothetical protein
MASRPDTKSTRMAFVKRPISRAQSAAVSPAAQLVCRLPESETPGSQNMLRQILEPPAISSSANRMSLGAGRHLSLRKGRDCSGRRKVVRRTPPGTRSGCRGTAQGQHLRYDRAGLLSV